MVFLSVVFILEIIAHVRESVMLKTMSNTDSLHNRKDYGVFVSKTLSVHDVLRWRPSLLHATVFQDYDVISH